MQEMLFSFKGRINRKPFWMFALVVMIGSFIIPIIDTAIMGQYAGVGSLIFLLIILWPSLALQVKRWHDRDKPGWWVLINFIPVIGGIWALVETGFLTGTEGSNRFGDNPLDQST